MQHLKYADILAGKQLIPGYFVMWLTKTTKKAFFKIDLEAQFPIP